MIVEFGTFFLKIFQHFVVENDKAIDPVTT